MFQQNAREVGFSQSNAVKQPSQVAEQLLTFGEKLIKKKADTSKEQGQFLAAQYANEAEQLRQEGEDVVETLQSEYSQGKGAFAELKSEAERLVLYQQQKGASTTLFENKMRMLKKQAFNMALESGADPYEFMKAAGELTGQKWNSVAPLDTGASQNQFNVEQIEASAKKTATDIGVPISNNTSALSAIQATMDVARLKAGNTARVAANRSNAEVEYELTSTADDAHLVVAQTLRSKLASISELRAQGRVEEAAAMADAVIYDFSSLPAWTASDSASTALGKDATAYSSFDRATQGKLSGELTPFFQEARNAIKAAASGTTYTGALTNVLTSANTEMTIKLTSELKRTYGDSTPQIVKNLETNALAMGVRMTKLGEILNGQMDDLTPSEKEFSNKVFQSFYEAGQKPSPDAIRKMTKELVSADYNKLAAYPPIIFTDPAIKTNAMVLTNLEAQIKNLKTQADTSLETAPVFEGKKWSDLYDFSAGAGGEIVIKPAKGLSPDQLASINATISKGGNMWVMKRLIESKAQFEGSSPVDIATDLFSEKPAAPETPATPSNRGKMPQQDKTSVLDLEGLDQADVMDIQSYILELKAKQSRSSMVS